MLNCSELKEKPGHYNDNFKPEGFDTKRVFVSPSIVYAGCDVYAKSVRYSTYSSIQQ